MQFILTLVMALIVFPMLMTWGMVEVMKNAPVAGAKRRRR